MNEKDSDTDVSPFQLFTEGPFEILLHLFQFLDRKQLAALLLINKFTSHAIRLQLARQVDYRIRTIEHSSNFNDLSDEALILSGEDSVRIYRIPYEKRPKMSDRHTIPHVLFGIRRVKQQHIVDENLIVIDHFGYQTVANRLGGYSPLKVEHFLESKAVICQTQAAAVAIIEHAAQYDDRAEEEVFENIREIFIISSSWPPPVRLVPMQIDDGNNSRFYAVIKGVKRWGDDDYPHKNVVKEEAIKVDRHGTITVHEYNDIQNQVYDKPSKFYSPKDFVPDLATAAHEFRFIGI